jgi:hypothetical protein
MLYGITDAPPTVDYLVPATGEASSSVAALLLQNDGDMGVLRPYRPTINNSGPSFYSKVVGYKPARTADGRLVMNRDGSVKIVPEYKQVRMTRNDATLRLLDWIQLDEAVVRAAKPRLRAAKDLEENGLVYMLPNGIAKTVIQYQEMTDITGATMSMDGLRQSEADRPLFNLVNYPLPLIHKDFNYPLRQLLASRTGYSPLDTETAMLAGRRVAEQIEQLTLGEAASTLMLGVNTYTFGGGTIYGFKNWPGRITYSITQPTTPGWTPQATVDDILQMKTLSQQNAHMGPWMIYVGLYWDRYMDDDYKQTYNDMTLRQRIREIDGVLDVRTVDYISDDSIIMVQMTTDVVRMIKGMDLTTIQWESNGGMQLNFKVMALVLPMLRGDYYGQTGLVHGS